MDIIEYSEMFFNLNNNKMFHLTVTINEILHFNLGVGVELGAGADFKICLEPEQKSHKGPQAPATLTILVHPLIYKNK